MMIFEDDLFGSKKNYQQYNVPKEVIDKFSFK